MLHPVRWLLRRPLVLVLALLNRQRQPRLSMSLVGLCDDDEAEIPTWARLRGSSDSHSVRKHLLCV